MTRGSPKRGSPKRSLGKRAGYDARIPNGANSVRARPKVVRARPPVASLRPNGVRRRVGRRPCASILSKIRRSRIRRSRILEKTIR